jgi:hypothetical protein
MNLSSCKNWLKHLKYNVEACGSGIDVVYTWVDGSNPKFQADLDKYRALEVNEEDPFISGKRRFRNSDELRYSLRSLESNAPWVNRIFLVTGGQVPAWLNLKHPRIRLVNHSDIFPDLSHLPTFNSLSIEMHMHRIRGLSNNFLYFNDDMFLGRPIDRSDFLYNDGVQKVRIEEWMLPDSLKEGDLVARCLSFNHQLLKQKYGDCHFFSPAHAPCLYNREDIGKVQEEWQNEFAVGSAIRFRTAKRVTLRILYPHYQAASKRAKYVLEPRENYVFVKFNEPLEKTINTLSEIKKIRPMFFTINDDWDGPCEIKDSMIQNFLQDYFPKPSSFEK